MTRLDKFLELFPNAKIEYGVPLPFPCELDTTLFPAWQEECGRAVGGDCTECAKQFWLQEVEPGEKRCGATGLPCIKCNPGACDNRKEFHEKLD